MFNYVYLLRIRNRLEDNVRKSFGSKTDVLQELEPQAASDDFESNVDLFDDDMSRLQEIAPDDYMDHRRDLPQQERDVFQFPIQRDNSEWLNPYAQERRDPQEEFAYEIAFYERASTGDQYW